MKEEREAGERGRKERVEREESKSIYVEARH